MVSLARNESVAFDLRLEAAALLYQRQDRWCASEEFATTFKAKVLDKLLISFKEAPPFQPTNVPAESLGRLYDHVNVLTAALGQSDKVHQENLAAHRSDLDSSDANLHDRVDQLAASASTSDLELAIAAARHRRAVEKQLDQRCVELITKDEELVAAIASYGSEMKRIESVLNGRIAPLERFAKQMKIAAYALGTAIPLSAIISAYVVVHFFIH